jgi:type II secretion system protein I
MNGKSDQRRENRQAGFTLLEVMVAVVILGLAYVAVLQSFSLSLANILRLENSKRSTLTATLEMDSLLRAGAEEGAASAGTLYLEGRRFKLMLVGGEGDELVTLRLVRNI